MAHSSAIFMHNAYSSSLSTMLSPHTEQWAILLGILALGDAPAFPETLLATLSLTLLCVLSVRFYGPHCLNYVDLLRYFAWAPAGFFPGVDNEGV